MKSLAGQTQPKQSKTGSESPRIGFNSHIHWMQILPHTKPSISSKTNILTRTWVQQVRVELWEMKKTTKYSGIPLRGPLPFLKPYLKLFQQWRGLFPNLSWVSFYLPLILDKWTKKISFFYLLYVKYCWAWHKYCNYLFLKKACVAICRIPK